MAEVTHGSFGGIRSSFLTMVHLSHSGMIALTELRQLKTGEISICIQSTAYPFDLEFFHLAVFHYGSRQ
jgi:hypothetical protein